MGPLESRSKWILLIPFLLVVFAWFNPLYHDVLAIFEEDSKKSLDSVLLLESLSLMAKAASSIKIPLISGIFQGAAETIEKVSGYLAISSITILVNTMLLKITHSKFIVVSMGIVLILAYFDKWRAIAVKVLLVAFLLNPGLSIYTKAVHFIDQQVQFSDKDQFHSQLRLIHDDYKQKEEQQKKEQQARKQKQLQKDEASGKHKLTLFQKLGDDVRNTASHVGHIAEDFRLTKEAIKFAAKKLMVLVLNYFTTVIFMYIVLPIGYLFLGYLLIKNLIPKIRTTQ